MTQAREKLSNLRKEAKLTHNSMAKKLGISRSYYTMIENGTRNPSLNLAFKIAILFNVDIKEIFQIH